MNALLSALALLAFLPQDAPPQERAQVQNPSAVPS